jgi:hypothetical protein
MGLITQFLPPPAIEVISIKIAKTLYEQGFMAFSTKTQNYLMPDSVAKCFK